MKPDNEFKQLARQKLEVILDEVTEELLDNIEVLVAEIVLPALERAAYGGPGEEDSR